MANEIDTGASAGEMIQAELLSNMIIPAAYGPSVMLPLVRRESLVGVPTGTGEYTKHPLLAAAGLTDGTAIGNSAYDPTSTQVTTVEVGISLEQTDLHRAESILNMDILAQQAGLAVANKIDTDLLAEVADFSNSVGTSSSDLTNANILSAIYTLKAGNAQDRGPIVGVLHPIQVFDLFTNLATLTGTPVPAMTGAPGFGVARSFNLYGIPFYESTLCASVNTNADRQGAMFVAGQGSGLIYQTKWDPRVELERDAKMRSWSVVVTAAYGDECIDTSSSAGVAIITDHE